MKKLYVLILLMLFMVGVASALNYNNFNTEPEFNPTAVATKTASYTATTSDSLINVNATTGNVTITLPSISSLAADGYSTKSFKIKKTDTTNNIVSVVPASTDTIEDVRAYVITKQNDFITIANDSATNWKVSYADDVLDTDVTTGEVKAGRNIKAYGDSGLSGNVPTVINVTSSQAKFKKFSYPDFPGKVSGFVTDTLVSIPAGQFTDGRSVDWSLAGTFDSSAGDKTFKLFVETPAASHGAIVTTTHWANITAPATSSLAFGSAYKNWKLECTLAAASSSAQVAFCELRVSHVTTTILSVVTSSIDMSSGGSFSIHTSGCDTAAGGETAGCGTNVVGTSTTTVDYIKVKFND